MSACAAAVTKSRASAPGPCSPLSGARRLSSPARTTPFCPLPVAGEGRRPDTAPKCLSAAAPSGARRRRSAASEKGTEMTSDEASAPSGGGTRARPGRCRSTPAWRTRPGCTTTCSAARTTTPLTGRPPRQCAQGLAGDGLHRAGEPGVPRARRPLPRRARRGSGSSWTSAPASRRRATPTRSPRRSRRSPGSCTWTTTRSCSLTPARCWSAARQVPPSTSTPTCATPARSRRRPAKLLDFTRPVAVTLIAILNAIPDSDDPHAIVASADGRRPVRQLPRPVPPGVGPPRPGSASTALRTCRAG